MRYKKAYIEITNNCNLNCDFCPKTDRKLSFMLVSDFEKIIKEVKPFTNFIYLHLMGEPLIHPNIKDILKVAEDNDVKVNITTNGFLIENKKDEIIDSKALRKISFSLHSYEGNSYIFNKSDKQISMEEYLNNILNAANLFNSKDVVTVLKLWNMDSENITASNKLNKNILQTIQDFFKLDYDLMEKLYESKNVKLDKHIYIQIANKFNWPNIENTEENNKIRCYGLIDQFGILVDGTVVPCCLDNNGTLILGNIHEERLEDILNSKRAQVICEANRNGIACEELCKKCEYARKM